jgi:hypothetical protein
MMKESLWRMMENHSRWETYPLASDMSKADALAYWSGPEDETFFVEEGKEATWMYW